MRVQEKGNGQALAIGSNVYSPKKNRFYALHFMGEQESYPDVLTGMLQVFSIDVYVLLDQGATLSFSTPLIARKFDVLPEIINEPFSLPSR